MTIVSMRPLHIDTSVSEKDLRHISNGNPVTIKAAAYPDVDLSGEIKEVSSIPVSSGRFSVKVSVDLPKDAEIVPGMTCSVEYEVPIDEDSEEDEADE